MIKNFTPKEEQKYYSIKKIYVFKYIISSKNKAHDFLANGLYIDLIKLKLIHFMEKVF